MIIPIAVGTKLFAAIGVTYPAGSTLSCTNGTKTMTAKNTSGQWVFAIPEIGTWTVTATDGSNTKSESVSITAEGQFESVLLSYRLNLYTNGVENVAWTTATTNSILKVVKGTDKLRFYTTESIVECDGQAYSSAVDLSGHSKLCIKGNSLLSGTLYFSVHTSSPAGKYKASGAAASLSVGGKVGAFEKYLDISGLDGDLYVNISQHVYYPEKGDHYYITEVWAE